jgi:SANTA (SANT Associated)
MGKMPRTVSRPCQADIVAKSSGPVGKPTSRATLHEWYLQDSSTEFHCSVQVVGHSAKTDDHRQQVQKFTTSSIGGRSQRNIITTISGSIYTLSGDLNREATVNNGFGPKVLRAFSRGFPVKWEEILEEDWKRRWEIGSAEECEEEVDEDPQPKSWTPSAAPAEIPSNLPVIPTVNPAVQVDSGSFSTFSARQDGQLGLIVGPEESSSTDGSEDACSSYPLVLGSVSENSVVNCANENVVRQDATFRVSPKIPENLSCEACLDPASSSSNGSAKNPVLLEVSNLSPKQTWEENLSEGN